jgi:hypothetical protein
VRTGSTSNGDYIGTIEFKGPDSNSNQLTYSEVAVQITDTTDGSEDAALQYSTTRAGSSGVRFSVGSGLYTGSHSDNGVDTITTSKYYYGTGGLYLSTGSGTPEGAVTAPIGSLFLRSDGGATTTLYVKTSGTGNTGWTAK